MALKFTIPDKLKPKNLETLSKGFGLPIAAASTPSIPDLPLGNIPMVLLDLAHTTMIHFLSRCRFMKFIPLTSQLPTLQ